MTDLSFPAASTASATAAVTAFVIAALSTRILEHLAPRLGLLDHPGGRKDHGRAVPLVGGIAVFLGFFGASCVAGMQVSPWLLVSMALMVCLGMIDDIFEIAPKKKLAGQLVVASLLTFASGAVIVSFGDLVGTGDLHPGRFGGVLTVFCLVGLVNALNMIDGLDGLAGGLGLVSALALAWAASLSGQDNAFLLLIALAAGIAGFLLFNLRLPWQPAARVFLGDAGSNLLGLTLAYFAVWMSQDSRGQPTALPPMSAVWLIGLPILDTLTVMARRIADRRSPFSAGRDHLHHILLALGLGHAATLWTMLAFASVLALCGMMGWRMGVSDWMMLWSAVAILIVYYAATRKVLNALAGRSEGKMGERAADQAQ